MPSDGLTLKVYDPTNTTLQGTLSQVLSAEFSDEFNATGFGSVAVPLSSSADKALLVKDNVVRVEYQGAARFAWLIEVLERDLATGGNQQIVKASGRGLLAILDDAVVFPQGGLADFSSDQRPFNYAAATGAWKSDYTWTTPLAVAWKSDATARANLPVKWRGIDPSASWIWSTNPSTAVQRGTVNWFRGTFTLSASTRLSMWASFDNFGEVWLDGTKVMDSSRFNETAPSFAQFVKFTTRLGAGTHTVAARVRNDKPWTRTDLSASASTDKVSASNHGLAAGTKVRVTDVSKSCGLTAGSDYFLVNVTADDFKLSTSSGGAAVNVTADAQIDLRLVVDSTAGFLFSCWSIDDDGKPNTLILRSAASAAWEVTTTNPKHLPAMILKTLMDEAAARNVYRFSKFTYGFSQSAPTSGAWSTKVDMALKVGSTLLDVLNTMVDLGVDFWLDPATMQLSAWEARGADKSSTVTLALQSNLLQYSTRAEPKLKTQALIRTKDGWTQKAANADTNGRRELYLEYGNTRDEDTARSAASEVLARTGKTQVVVSQIEAAVVSGAAPYVDFTVGDFVSVPNADGSGTATARVLAIAIQHDGLNIRFMPELEVL